MRFGFKYMTEPQQELEEIEETTEMVTGNCVYCGCETDLVVEHDNSVRLHVPVCRKHYTKFKGKENTVEKMVDAIKIFIMS